MEDFEEYKDRFAVAAMERDDRGVLTVRLHSEGGPLLWGHIGGAHEQLSQAFGCIARDRRNAVVILTGTGDIFTGPRASAKTFPLSTTRSWETIQANQFDLTWNLLAIDAPVISCVNGPAWRHPEIPLLGDIVLACKEASFQDSAHFVNRTVPGDGVNLVMTALLGLNRGRYFLLTGQEISAAEAHELGLVAEIVERDDLLDRAREIADMLIEQNPLVLRYTRRLLMQPLKEQVLRHLGHGAALEGLAAIDETAMKQSSNEDGG